MYSRDAIAIALEKLEKDDFYRPAHIEIFHAISELFVENKPVDLTGLSDKLASTPHKDGTSVFDHCGGRLYLVSLVENIVTDKNCAYHCAIVKDGSVRRKIISTGRELVENASNEFRKTEETIVSGESRLLACAGIIGNGTPTGRVSFFGRYDQPHTDTISTGIAEFDRATGGLNKGDPVIIAARPSLGKTSLLLQMLRHICKDGKKALMFPYETTKETIIDRIVVGELGLDRWQWKTRRLVQPDSKKFLDACVDGGALNIIEQNLLIDESRPDPRRFALALRLYKNRFPFDVVFVDYIQLMAGSEENADVSAASKMVSNAAKEHKVPIVVASQLRRQQAERYDPRPKLSDLRGSGALEQDARMVAFIWNPVAPLRQAIDLSEPEQRKVEQWRDKVRFILAKNSEGDVAEFDLGWEGKYSRFYALEKHREDYFRDDETIGR